MNRTDILDMIKSLANSQGFYSRLYQNLQSEEGEEFLTHLESKNFKDSVDLILYLEG